MLILVCGWPACGKSYYGEWLQEHRGFRHLDLDEENFDDSGRLERWRTLMPADAARFVAGLREENERWILTWNLPKECMPHLTALQAEGFQSWFFLPGAEPRSRLEWLQRERAKDPTVGARAWDRRVEGIRQNARDLRRFFRDHCIETLSSQGERMPCELLATRMDIAVSRA